MTNTCAKENDGFNLLIIDLMDGFLKFVNKKQTICFSSGYTELYFLFSYVKVTGTCLSFSVYLSYTANSGIYVEHFSLLESE